MWKEGDRVLCISDHGWTPGCITVGKVYEVCSVKYNEILKEERVTIMANYNVPFVTGMSGFKLLSEVRNDKLKQLGI
jgi:hypothetical protein